MRKIFLISIPALIAGLIIGFTLPKEAINYQVGENASQVREGFDGFINPLLECEISEGRINKEIISFKNLITEYTDQKTTDGSAQAISVYFRDLNNGPWIGINEKTDFAPASLLKVPMMLAYLHRAQSNPEILIKKIKFTKTKDRTQIQHFKPALKLEEDKEYAVDELIERMIIYSDNNALRLLGENINKRELDSLYANLSVNISNSQKALNFMNIKQYATFFRVLYNASYLNQDMSNKALSILSKTAFPQGIVAGIPKKIIVAHKFGEISSRNSYNQLHDCGIVYYPSRPYLLCVMTRGKDFNKLEAILKQISKIIYEQVDKQLTKRPLKK